MKSIVFGYLVRQSAVRHDLPTHRFLRNFLYPVEYVRSRLTLFCKCKSTSALLDPLVTITTMKDIANDPKLIDLRDLMTLVGLGRTATYELTQQHSFPTPYRISRKTIRWNRQEVVEWLNTRKGISSKTFTTKRNIRKAKTQQRIIVAGVGFRRNNIGVAK